MMYVAAKKNYYGQLGFCMYEFKSWWTILHMYRMQFLNQEISS